MTRKQQSPKKRKKKYSGTSAEKRKFISQFYDQETKTWQLIKFDRQEFKVFEEEYGQFFEFMELYDPNSKGTSLEDRYQYYSIGKELESLAEEGKKIRENNTNALNENFFEIIKELEAIAEKDEDMSKFAKDILDNTLFKEILKENELFALEDEIYQSPTFALEQLSLIKDKLTNSTYLEKILNKLKDMDLEDDYRLRCNIYFLNGILWKLIEEDKKDNLIKYFESNYQALDTTIRLILNACVVNKVPKFFIKFLEDKK